MGEREKKEEKNKRIGWLTSVGVQLLLLILFYFIIAWREPFPPIPEYGIELGFTTSAGAPNTSSPSQEAPETEEVPQETDQVPSEETPPETSDPEPTPEQAIIPNEVESPVKVEETETEQEKVAEEIKEEVDSRAVMKPSETDTEDTSDNPTEGKEEKEVDQRAIYGSQGTNEGDSEGANLKLAGWEWVSPPEPDDTSNASGKIVFKIVVDKEGYIIKITTVESNIPKLTELKYRDAVSKLSFVKTDGESADQSSGTITFIIKSR